MTENDEIRLKIAKLKGYLPFPENRCPVCGFPMDHCEPGNCSMRPVPNIRADENYPNWPESIADAWELVEECQNAGVGFDICNVKHSVLTSGQVYWQYEVTLYDPIEGPNSTEHKANADTTPLAICKCWIPWKEAQK